MILKKFYNKLGNFIKRTRKFGFRNDIFLANKVQMLGIDFIEIGTNTTIGENTLITINNRELPGNRLIIGNNVYIGRSNLFTTGKKIIVGDFCMFGNNCSFLGSNHNFETPLFPYAATGATNEFEIYLGVNCWLGHGVSVVGNVKIGHGSIIGANSVVTKDVPPFSVAVGNPAKVIKRFNFKNNNWEKGYMETTYINEGEYLQILKSKTKQLPLQHYGASSEFGDL